MGIRKEACGGVFIGENAHNSRIPSSTRRENALGGCEGIVAGEIQEAVEVAVVCVDGATVFEGDGGDGHVGEVGTTHVGLGCQSLIDDPVIIAGIKDPNVWKCQPRINGCRRFLQSHSSGWAPGVR